MAVYCDKFADIHATELLIIVCSVSVTSSYVSAVGATGEQMIGDDHNSWVIGHGSRGSRVSLVMGQLGHRSQDVTRCQLCPAPSNNMGGCPAMVGPQYFFTAFLFNFHQNAHCKLSP